MDVGAVLMTAWLGDGPVVIAVVVDTLVMNAVVMNAVVVNAVLPGLGQGARCHGCNRGEEGHRQRDRPGAGASRHQGRAQPCLG